MPGKGYSNLTVRQDVRKQLDMLREELGFSTLNDLLVFLVRSYRAYTTIGSKLDELITSIGSISQRLDILVQVVNTATSGSNSTSSGSMKKRKKITMLDVIKERKIQFLSEVNPRDPDKFISRAHDLGIVVLEGSRDVAFVDPSFYSGFLDKLKTVGTSNEELVRKELDSDYYRLFVFLRENGLIYFDASDRVWRLIG